MAELKEQKYMLEIAKVQGIGKAAENLFIYFPTGVKQVSCKNRRDVWNTTV